MMMPQDRIDRMPYSGPERRKNRAFVTLNTEYHVKDAQCVAVRDRRTGRWLAGHKALRRKLVGALRPTGDGIALPFPTDVVAGLCLCFDIGGQILITSPVQEVARPEKDAVGRYLA